MLNSPTTRALVGSMLGSMVEFYDIFIYAIAASLVLGPAYFPSSSQSAQQLAAYASFGVAFIARPFGSVLFGSLGDRGGRKSTFLGSLALVAGATFLVTLLPTWREIGLWAPILLCLLRFLQGLGLGGEFGGAALMAVENAPPGWRQRFGSAPQLGAPIGFSLACAVFLLLERTLGTQAFESWGWRLAFLFSALLALTAVFIRRRLSETPVFLELQALQALSNRPARTLVREHWPTLISAALVVSLGYTLFYIVTTFLLGHGVRKLGLPIDQVLLAQVLAMAVMGLSILVSGIAADRWGPRPLLVLGALAAIAAASSLVHEIDSWWRLALCGASLTAALGLGYAPLGAWLPSLFPPRLRCVGAALSFNLGGVLGAALAPYLAQQLVMRVGMAWVGAYVAGMALVSLSGLLLLRARAEPAPQSSQALAP